jgi:hypothetical protein
MHKGKGADMVRCDLRISRAALTAGLVLGAGVVSACGSPMNMARIEADIKADIERQGRRLTLAAVRCPEAVTPQTGGYFRCIGELQPEGTFTINVVQADAQGNVTWEVPNSRVMLNLARVEATIQDGLTKAFSKRALVDCGSELYRVNQSGDRFECAIVGGLSQGSETFTSVLVRVDPDGNLNWQELRHGSQTATVGAASPASAPGATTRPTGAEAPNSSPPSPAPVKTTTVTGPSGRNIERPYLPGDDD